MRTKRRFPEYDDGFKSLPLLSSYSLGYFLLNTKIRSYLPLLIFYFLTLSCSGSLLNLAKHPASTVQILGAEKALFRALKTRKDTPKYGLIYHASLVGQTTAKNKGKVCSGEPREG